MQAQSQVEYTGLFTIQQHVAVQKGGLRPRQPGSAGEGHGNKHQRQGCEPTTGMRSSLAATEPQQNKRCQVGETCTGVAGVSEGSLEQIKCRSERGMHKGAEGHGHEMASTKCTCRTRCRRNRQQVPAKTNDADGTGRGRQLAERTIQNWRQLAVRSTGGLGEGPQVQDRRPLSHARAALVGWLVLAAMLARRGFPLH